MRTRPLKLIEFPCLEVNNRKFYAKVPDGMLVEHAVVVANAIIKQANRLYASDSGDPDTGAVYDTIVRDLAAAGFGIEASRIQVLASDAWDRPGPMSEAEQKVIDELEARRSECAAVA